jgi:hypothetical protein
MINAANVSAEKRLNGCQCPGPCILVQGSQGLVDLANCVYQRAIVRAHGHLDPSPL